MRSFDEYLSELDSDFLLLLEAGVNHDGELSKALQLIDSASQTGAHVVKFQTYTAEKIAAPESPSYWDLNSEPTTSQIELFKKYDSFSVLDYEKLATESKMKNIGFLSTCFDQEWVELIDHLLPFYKIASADITNYPLIKTSASKNKPILLSTGAASISEIRTTLDFIGRYTSAQVCLMHCVLNYPTLPQNANLGRISELQAQFPDSLIGYSDHTQPPYSFDAIAFAYLLGARVFETHFTMDKKSLGNDHYHSLDSADVTRLIEKLQNTSQMLNYTEERFLSLQAPAREFARRGLYAAQNLETGHIITEADLIPLRPTLGDDGFSADEYETLIGKKINQNIEAFGAIRGSLIQ